MLGFCLIKAYSNSFFFFLSILNSKISQIYQKLNQIKYSCVLKYLKFYTFDLNKIKFHMASFSAETSSIYILPQKQISIDCKQIISIQISRGQVTLRYPFQQIKEQKNKNNGDMSDELYFTIYQQFITNILEFGRNIFNNLQDLKIQLVNNIRIPCLNAPNLTNLQLHSIKFKKTLNQFALGKYSQLTSIKICKSSGLKNLPKINAPKLFKIIISETLCEDIQQFCSGSYPNMVHLQFREIGIKQLPKLNAPKLQTIQISKNFITSIKNFFKGNHPNLRLFNASNNHLSQFPSFQIFPLIQQIEMNSNRLKNIDGLKDEKYQNLKLVSFDKNRIQQIPKINAPQLFQVSFENNCLRLIDQFSSIKYEKLQKINLNYNNLKKNIPFIDAPLLRNFQIAGNNYTVLNSWLEGNYPNLMQFQGSKNKYQQIPAFLALPQVQKLSVIILSSNQIKNIEILSHINLQFIKSIVLSDNQIYASKVFKKLKIPCVSLIQLGGNNILQFNQLAKSQIVSQTKNKKNYECRIILESKQQSRKVGAFSNFQWIYKLNGRSQLILGMHKQNQWRVSKAMIKQFHEKFGKYSKFNSWP